MGVGIHVCGLNGCGKSTLGKALADALGFHLIDVENLYFRSDDELYAQPRKPYEVERLLMNEIHAHPDFVLTAVKGLRTKEGVPAVDYVVVMEVPGEIRMQRVKKRSLQKFGEKLLTDETLRKQEEDFFQMAAARTDAYVETWLQTVKCPVLRIDGTKPADENVEYIRKQTGL